MSLIRLGLIGVLASGLWSTSAQAQIQAADLQPLDEWQVERLTDRCIIRRAFGSPNAPTIVELRTIDPWSGGYQTAILSNEFAATGEPFRAVWLPGGRVQDVDLFTLIEGDGDARGVVFSTGIQDASMQVRVVGQDGPFNVLEMDQDYTTEERQNLLAGIESLLIVDAFEAPLLIATGPMQDVMQLREPCVNEVLVSQGVDPTDAERGDSRVEMTNHISLITRLVRRMPREIRRRDRPTNVSFLLYLDADAEPRSCRMVSLPYEEAFERRSCDLPMSQAEFEFNEGENAQPTFYKASGFLTP